MKCTRDGFTRTDRSTVVRNRHDRGVFQHCPVHTTHNDFLSLHYNHLQENYYENTCVSTFRDGGSAVSHTGIMMLEDYGNRKEKKSSLNILPILQWRLIVPFFYIEYSCAIPLLKISIESLRSYFQVKYLPWSWVFCVVSASFFFFPSSQVS